MKTTLYTLLVKHNLSQRDMGEKSGINYKKISRLVKILEKRGYISVKRARASHGYGNEQNVYTGLLF